MNVHVRGKIEIRGTMEKPKRKPWKCGPLISFSKPFPKKGEIGIADLRHNQGRESRTRKEPEHLYFRVQRISSEVFHGSKEHSRHIIEN
jgi:hypothetical protein